MGLADQSKRVHRGEGGGGGGERKKEIFFYKRLRA